MNIADLLRISQEQGASDLHLRAWLPPFIRISGELAPMVGHASLDADDMVDALSQIATEPQRLIFEKEGELEFAYSLPGTGRFRANISRQVGAVAMALRVLPEVIPTLEELGLPAICRSLALKLQGLVIVTGPTGSGKSTTLAAMISYLNQTVARHIVTIEDPIEFLHQSHRCLISQRELGTDTRSFATALKHVLRQDPDMILLGEMRDPETAVAAITAAETGHLVLTTGHAPSAPGTIDRLLSLFPSQQEAGERLRLASVLQGVLCQTLVPTKDGKGRIVAMETMPTNIAVRNIIREGKTYQLPNVLHSGSNHGMKTMDQALVELYQRNIISEEEVLNRCSNRDEIERLIPCRHAGAVAEHI